MLEANVPMDPRITLLAEWFMGHELKPQEIYRSMWPQNSPEELKNLIKTLTEEFQSGLSTQDRDTFHVDAVLHAAKELTYDAQLARIKLSVSVYYAMRKLRIEMVVNGHKNSPLLEVVPTLEPCFDQEELINLKNFKHHYDALVFDKFVIELNQFIPYELKIRLFSEPLSTTNNFTVKCALDFRKPVLQEQYRSRVQEQKSWGKPFNPREELTSPLKESPAYSEYRRSPDAQEELGFFSPPIEKVEVQRTEKSDCFSFLIEELIPMPEAALEVGYVCARIFHSEFIREQQAFRHVDGSLLIYNIETYERRLRSKMKQKIKAEHHIKLFRFDGRVTYETWQEVLQAFYPEDELIQEFLSGK